MSPVAARLTFVQASLHPDLQSALIEAWQAAGAGEPRAEPIVLVVPTHLLGVHLRRAHARQHGVNFQLRALTWRGLAAEITAEERRASGCKFLNQEAPGWLVRQLGSRRGRRPGTFDELLDMRGFRAALLHTFGELGRAGLASCAEVEAVLAGGRDAGLPARVRDALELYLAYRRSFETTHDDLSSMLARAARAPRGRVAAALGTSRLWIYGFAALDRLESRLLARLATDPGLELRAFVPRPDPEPLSPVAELLGLGFVDLGPSAPPAPRLAPEVRALSVPGEESEADEMARQLLAAAGEGIAFSDMAVVTRSPRRLELLRAALVRCGIPCWVADGESLQNCRSGRALLFWFDLIESGLTTNAAMTFLGVAPLRWRDWAGIAADPVPSAWERAAREAFLGSGLADWSAKLELKRQEQEDRAEQFESEGEPGQRARASAQACSELLAVARVLESEMARFPARGRWGEYVDAVRSLLERAFEPSREVESLLASIERLGDLDTLGIAPPPPSRTDFRDAVRQALAESALQDVGYGAHPGVTLGTAAALRGLDFEVVCLAGVQGGEWPGPASEDPVCLESGRAALGAALGDAAALPPRSRAIERDRVLFWEAAGAARRRLVLGFARLDPDTGATRLPSSLVLELAERCTGRSLDYVELQRLPWVERVPLRRPAPPADLPLLGLAEHDTLVAAALPPEAASRYVQALGGFAGRGLTVDRLRHRRRRFTRADGVLRASAARQALRERFAAVPWSATQLSTYTTCPFRFFMRHVLKLEPLERDERREPSALEMGRLVHRILQSFYNNFAPRGGGSRRDLPAAEERRLLHEAAAAVFKAVEVRGQTGAHLLWQIRKQRLREDLLRFLREERASWSSGWEPSAVEHRFGPDTGCEPRVQCGGATVTLRGSIDRLDVHPQHDGVRVVDYKSGKPLDSKSGAGPQVLQLVVYLFAATGGDRQRLARSEGRFLYVTRRGGFGAQILSGSVLAARRADFEHLVCAVRRGVRAGDFFPQPGRGAVHCAACDYQGVCDARIARLAEVKAEAGQTRRFLELPDFAAGLVTSSGAEDGPAGVGEEVEP